jgi:phospholipid transport system transporter-binding protein
MQKRKKATTTRVTPGARRRARAAGAGQPALRGVFAVPSECTIADADALKSGLAKLLEHPDAVTLDISAVQRIDTAGLQLIASFVRERAAHGRRIEWQGAAPAFSTAADLLGLSSLLQVPAQASRRAEEQA